MAVANSYNRPGAKGESFNQQKLVLRQTMAAKALTQQFGGLGGSDKSGEGLDPVLEKVAKARATNPTAAAIDAAARTELGKPVSEPVLAVLRKGNPTHRVFAEIYGAKKLPRKEAQRLADKLPAKDPLGAVARVHALEKAGDKEARAKMMPVWRMAAVGLMALGAVGLLLLGVFLWVAYVAMRHAGNWQPLGHPAQPMSLPRADRFALRGLQLLGMFLLLTQILGPVIQSLSLPKGMSGILTVMVMFALTFLLFRTPVAGQRVSLYDVGLRRDNLGRNILLGFAGFAANLPIMAIAVGIGQLLQRYFPEPSHPATEILQQSPTPLMILAIFLQAAVLAPFWEEIMFRGLLFPALSRVTRSVAAGALTSSFMFAAIHPQGIPLWLGLGSVAVTSCVLSHHSRSLVPSIVMHAVHNSVLLTLTLVMFG
jgi:hypothetical protein